MPERSSKASMKKLGGLVRLRRQGGGIRISLVVCGALVLMTVALRAWWGRTSPIETRGPETTVTAQKAWARCPRSIAGARVALALWVDGSHEAAVQIESLKKAAESSHIPVVVRQRSSATDRPKGGDHVPSGVRYAVFARGRPLIAVEASDAAKLRALQHSLPYLAKPGPLRNPAGCTKTKSQCRPGYRCCDRPGPNNR